MDETLINVGEDYPLFGALTSFEAYMLATTEKQIEKQASLELCEAVVVNGKEWVKRFSLDELKDRKNVLSLFNATVKEKKIALAPNNFSCFLIDITTNDNTISIEEAETAYNEIIEHSIEWLKENDRVALVAQHFYQYNRVPHIHFLYERKKRKHNELQEYLTKEAIR